jgi:hypothetical protein
MAALALVPGPAVGEALRRAREAQALGLVRTRDEALAWLLREDRRDVDEESGGGAAPPDRSECPG